MEDSAVYNTLAVNFLVCVVFSSVGIFILSNLYYLVSNKLFKIKNMFGFSSLVIYVSLFLIIAYSIGVLFSSVHYGEFVLVDENLMNTLFWGSTGITRAIHLTYIVSSVILVVLFKHYLYEPHTEKQV